MHEWLQVALSRLVSSDAGKGSDSGVKAVPMHVDAAKARINEKEEKEG